MPRFSTLGALFSALAAAAYVRADLAFTANIRAAETNLSLVAAALDALPRPATQVEYAPVSVFSVTEHSIFWMLIVVCAISCATALCFSWLAKRRNESSLRWAWPILLSYVVAFFVVRLLGWSSSISTV